MAKCIVKTQKDKTSTKSNTQKKVLCDACGFKAKSNKSLSNHKKIHKTRHTYMRTCNKYEFQGNNYQFYTHNDKVHKNIDSKCKKCEVILKYQAVLQNHIKNKHPINEGEKFPSESCDYLSTKKLDLTKHIKSVHVTISKKLDTIFIKLYLGKNTEIFQKKV